MAIRALDSQGRPLGVFERWKRGAVVLAIVALTAAAGTALLAVPTVLILEALGIEGWSSVIYLVAGLAAAPWVLGNRATLRTIGSLASLDNDRG